jgi:hypothetical protein
MRNRKREKIRRKKRKEKVDSMRGKGRSTNRTKEEGLRRGKMSSRNRKKWPKENRNNEKIGGGV